MDDARESQQTALLLFLLITIATAIAVLVHVGRQLFIIQYSVASLKKKGWFLSYLFIYITLLAILCIY
jgi:hypothetical protein